MIIPNLIALEYSVSQNCFHIQTLKETIQENMMNAFNRGNNDYVLLAVFENELDAHDFSEKFRAAMDEQNRKDVNKLINDILNSSE